MSENSLVIFTRAAQMLAEANTIQKAKELKDLALTAADWAKRKGMGKEAIRYAQTYARQAEIRMGEILAETERAVGTDKGGRQYIDSNMPLPSNAPPTLADLGLTKRESSQAQMLANAPEDLQEEYVGSEKSATQVKRETIQRTMPEIPELPSGKYRVVYADPPWSYGNTQPDYQTEQRDYYSVMKLMDICALDIKGICEDNAVLFLWVTSPILEESFQVIKAWGFKYKSSFIWDKIKHNMGHYNSVRHELLLICTRGSCQPDVPKLFDSVQTIERIEHSRKPAEFYEIIEALYPRGRRVELFSRGKREGWEAYGNEA